MSYLKLPLINFFEWPLVLSELSTRNEFHGMADSPFEILNSLTRSARFLLSSSVNRFSLSSLPPYLQALQPRHHSRKPMLDPCGSEWIVLRGCKEQRWQIKNGIGVGYIDGWRTGWSKHTKEDEEDHGIPHPDPPRTLWSGARLKRASSHGSTQCNNDL